ncbi:hypothetical protein Ancab_009924 [Ancistrocladus abbreviatus]
MEWEEGQLSIARAIDEDIILSQIVSGYNQNLWRLSGNQDDQKIKPARDDFGNFFKKIQANEKLQYPQEEVAEWQERFDIDEHVPAREEAQLEDLTANMNRTNYISEIKNEILNMDSIIRDDATIVVENVINESLVDKEERELFHLIDSNFLPKMQMSDSYQDPTGNNEEGEQSSDSRLESLHNKLEDLPMDEIVIKESFIMGKETQMASIGSQMEKKQVDDTKLLTYMRSSVSKVELVDVEDNEAEDDRNNRDLGPYFKNLVLKVTWACWDAEKISRLLSASSSASLSSTSTSSIVDTELLMNVNSLALSTRFFSI